ncbi:MAG: HPP family protein [Bradymonadia bacterium]
MIMLIGSYGATSVVLLCLHDAPIARPRNLILGHLIAAVVGVLVRSLDFPDPLALGLSLGLTITLMVLLDAIHPPGGAVALIAILSPPEIIGSGWGFIFGACCLGVVTYGLMAFLWVRLLNVPGLARPRPPSPSD